MISSVREVVVFLAPKSGPDDRNAAQPRYARGAVGMLFSRIAPPIAMVSPSFTVTCVLIERLEKEGDWIAALAAGAIGALTC